MKVAGGMMARPSARYWSLLLVLSLIGSLPVVAQGRRGGGQPGAQAGAQSGEPQPPQGERGAGRGGRSTDETAPEAEPLDEASRDPLSGLRFRNLGPAVGGGRVTAVTGVSGQPGVYYVGAAAGGVFKTVDGGFTWRPVFEKEKTASIGAIAVAPSNPMMVWVGTGEANFRNDIVTGKGIYLSTDGGASWEHKGLDNAGQIANVIVSPSDPNNVYACVIGHQWGPNPDRGVFRTTDAGKSWQKVLFVNDHTGCADMIMDPGNPQVLFAGMWQAQRTPWMLESGGPDSGIYRSIDGGATWKKLANGLPQGAVGRIGLAAAPSNPEHIYALIEAKNGTLWDSHDLGEHWRMVSSEKKIITRGFYFTHLTVAPNDENKVYFLSYDILLSEDGGKTSTAINRGVHVDNHSIWIDPQDPNRIIEGNDGGVYVSTNAGRNWRYLDNLPIEQFYMVATDEKQPYMLCGGLQDNNGWCGPSNSLSRGPQSGADWFTVVGGDGEYVVPVPKSNLIYADSQNGSIQKLDTSTGMSRSVRPYLFGVGNMPPSKLKYRFNWTSPIAVLDEKTAFVGGNVLFKTTNGGETWDAISPDLTRNDKTKQESSGGKIELDLSGAETFDTILSVAVSKSDPKVIWVGTDDGLVQVTQDGGAHWENVTKNVKVPEWGRIQQIEVSPFSPGTAYVAWDLHEVENNKPFVFKTHDFGKTWQEITAGLPQDDPARVVREDPNQKGFLVLGTDTGLFYSADEGMHWTALKSNFPTTPVYDVQFEKSNHDLLVATHGRGLFVLDDVRPLEETGSGAANADLKLFTVAPATRWVTWNKRGQFSTGGFIAPNPANGAVISYWLKDRLRPTPEQRRLRQTPVKITVTDEAGKVVRTFFGPANQGYNRAVWDLRYNDSVRLALRPVTDQPEEESFFPRGGPSVPPGNYKVTITANGKSETQTVAVNADPRFNIPAENFKQQAELSLELRDQLSALNRALNRVNNLRRQVTTLQSLLAPQEELELASVSTSGDANGYAPVLKAATDLDKKLKAYVEPIYNLEAADENDRLHFLSKFHDRVQGIYRTVSGGYGQLPNDMVKEEVAEVQKELASQLQAFNTLVEGDVSTFNKLALQHGANTLFAGPPIQLRQNDGAAATAVGTSGEDILPDDPEQEQP